jgi:hypothetical protein
MPLTDERLLELSSMPSELMKLCKDEFGMHFLQFEIWASSQLRQAVAEAEAAMKERCVKVCDEIAEHQHVVRVEADGVRVHGTASQCAEAIREMKVGE